MMHLSGKSIYWAKNIKLQIINKTNDFTEVEHMKCSVFYIRGMLVKSNGKASRIVYRGLLLSSQKIMLRIKTSLLDEMVVQSNRKTIAY